jgi:hypothetical protein
MAKLEKIYSWLQYDVATDQRTPAAYPGTLQAIKAAEENHGW